RRRRGKSDVLHDAERRVEDLECLVERLEVVVRRLGERRWLRRESRTLVERQVDADVPARLLGRVDMHLRSGYNVGDEVHRIARSGGQRGLREGDRELPSLERARILRGLGTLAPGSRLDGNGERKRGNGQSAHEAIVPEWRLVVAGCWLTELSCRLTYREEPLGCRAERLLPEPWARSPEPYLFRVTWSQTSAPPPPAMAPMIAPFLPPMSAPTPAPAAAVDPMITALLV